MPRAAVATYMRGGASSSANLLSHQLLFRKFVCLCPVEVSVILPSVSYTRMVTSRSINGATLPLDQRMSHARPTHRYGPAYPNFNRFFFLYICHGLEWAQRKITPILHAGMQRISFKVLCSFQLYQGVINAHVTSKSTRLKGGHISIFQYLRQRPQKCGEMPPSLLARSAAAVPCRPPTPTRGAQPRRRPRPPRLRPRVSFHQEEAPLHEEGRCRRSRGSLRHRLQTPQEALQRCFRRGSQAERIPSRNPREALSRRPPA